MKHDENEKLKREYIKPTIESDDAFQNPTLACNETASEDECLEDPPTSS
tara:strand:- start:913 stop:1059 length:147 start_codon:yes stop_codon:yes gene_type:complete